MPYQEIFVDQINQTLAFSTRMAIIHLSQFISEKELERGERDFRLHHKHIAYLDALDHVSSRFFLSAAQKLAEKIYLDHPLDDDNLSEILTSVTQESTGDALDL